MESCLEPSYELVGRARSLLQGDPLGLYSSAFVALLVLLEWRGSDGGSGRSCRYVIASMPDKAQT